MFHNHHGGESEVLVALRVGWGVWACLGLIYSTTHRCSLSSTLRAKVLLPTGSPAPCATPPSRDVTWVSQGRHRGAGVIWV